MKMEIIHKLELFNGIGAISHKGIFFISIGNEFDKGKRNYYWCFDIQVKSGVLQLCADRILWKTTPGGGCFDEIVLRVK